MPAKKRQEIDLSVPANLKIKLGVDTGGAEESAAPRAQADPFRDIRTPGEHVAQKSEKSSGSSGLHNWINTGLVVASIVASAAILIYVANNFDRAPSTGNFGGQTEVQKLLEKYAQDRQQDMLPTQAEMAPPFVPAGPQGQLQASNGAQRVPEAVKQHCAAINVEPFYDDQTGVWHCMTPRSVVNNSSRIIPELANAQSEAEFEKICKKQLHGRVTKLPPTPEHPAGGLNCGS